jgi:DNA-binding beta-propeller fold protein YncE
VRKVSFLLFLFLLLSPALLAKDKQKVIIGKVTKVTPPTPESSGEILIDKGENAGVKGGMLFDVFRESKVVVIPGGKGPLFVATKKVALIGVTNPEPDFAHCAITSKASESEEVKVGDIVATADYPIEPVNTPPFIESVKGSISEPYAGEDVVVTCNVTDSPGKEHIYTWSATGGQLESSKTSCGTNVWVCPATAEPCTISVSVDDLRGGKAQQEIQIKCLGTGPRGSVFAPVSVFGDASIRFRQIVSLAFDQENRLLLLDGQEKRLITLGRDFTAERVSAFFGEDFSLSQMYVFGRSLYVIDAHLATVYKYELEGDIFRRKPLRSYGSKGSSNGFFSTPVSVALNKHGDVYVLDGPSCSIHIFDAEGVFLLSLGKRGMNQGEILGPVSIAIDSSDTLYVCDRQRRKVLVYKDNAFDHETDYERGIVEPIDLKIDPVTGNIGILDRSTRSVKVFDRKGALKSEIGASANRLSSLEDCEKFAFSRTGEIFVVCYNGAVLKRFSATGEFLGCMGGEDLSSVTIFTAGPDGEMFFLSPSLYTVWRMDRQGWLTTKFGSYGTGKGQFLAPIALACDSRGCVYILDEDRYDVQKFSPEGTHVATFGKSGGGKEEIDYPMDIYAREDKVYLLQYRQNYSVQVYDTSGNIRAVFPDKESQTIKPYKVSADARENAFVFSSKWYLEAFDRQGTKLGKVSDTKFFADDIAVDVRGDLYCVSADYGKIMRVDTSGSKKWTLKTPPICRYPAGISFDRYGRMYLFDSETRCVVRLKEIVR